MYKAFRPDMFFDSITDVDIKMLKRIGVTGLVLDLDNTLAAPDSKEPDQKVRQWIVNAMKEGIKIVIASNSLPSRVRNFSEQLNIKCVSAAMKPLKRAFARAVSELGMPPDKIAVVGDQLFTDIIGAKNSGLRAILVNPISKRERVWTRIIARPIERIIRKRLGIP